jgi:flagellar motility protein MotE (MotC chaperone)
MATLIAPRLLPFTIAALAALLSVKSVALVRAAMPAASATAALAVAKAPTPAQPVSAPAQPAATPGQSAATPAKATGKQPPQQQPRPPPPPPPAEPPAVGDAERAVLLQLRQRRQELDARELGVAARESLLAAAEQKLNARVEELTALQKKLEALEAARTQREELGWQGLVKVYEVMKPRDAAVIFNDLAMPVLLPVLDRMKDAKAALILAAMTPDKAREVTAALAKLRISRNTPAGAVAATSPGG